MMFETNPADKVCILTLQQKNTQNTFQLHDDLTCAQRGLVLFLCICCCRHDVHFRALGQETAGGSSSKVKTSGARLFLGGGKIGAAPKGILPKRIQMKRQINRDH